MKEYTSDNIRNIALVSHSNAGKTMLTEAFLHFTGATTRMGKIEDGTTTSDFDEEEIRRTISVYTTVIPVEYKGIKLNILDTPGYNDFVGEVISALRVADSAVVLVDSVAGREVGTEVAWRYCDEFNLPRFVLINKMNRENANFRKAVESVQEYTEMRLLPVQLPLGEKLDFAGVIDILSKKAFKASGKEVIDIPAEYQDDVEAAYMELVEAAAEGEDELLEKYFETGELSLDEIYRGLASAMKSGSFAPVFVAAGAAEIGIAPLLDSMVKLLPSPVQAPAVTAQGASGEEELSASDSGPLAVYTWKTTADPFVGKQTYFRVYSGTLNADSRIWNQARGVEERFGNLLVPSGKDTTNVKVLHAGDIGMVAKLGETATGDTLCDKSHALTLPQPEYPNPLFSVAVFPKTQADSSKISTALARLTEEDMTLNFRNEPATKQTILEGMGDQHIDVVIRRAETKLQVNLLTETPKIPYREAINGKGEATYRHKKQSGGSGQFGEVSLRVATNPDGDYEFSNDVFGGAISASYMPAIEKGIKAVMIKGVLAGYPISGVKVSVYDGKEHPVDSKPIAFETAGREAFKIAFKEAKPVLREPIYTYKVVVPEANMGDILGDLSTRRAKVQGMDTVRGQSIVTAQVPLAEMQRYNTDLRSMTGGRGIYSLEFSHYEVVPSHITQEIIAQKEKDEAED
jgi:elongation factor G